MLRTRGTPREGGDIGYRGDGEWFHTQEEWLEPGSYSMKLVHKPEVCDFDEENDQAGIATQPGEVEFSNVYVQVYAYGEN